MTTGVRTRIRRSAHVRRSAASAGSTREASRRGWPSTASGRPCAGGQLAEDVAELVGELGIDLGGVERLVLIRWSIMAIEFAAAS